MTVVRSRRGCAQVEGLRWEWRCCQTSTTANAVIGAEAFSAGRQSVVQAFRIRLFDSANTLFEQQGYFAP